ncbi:MAG: response regulator [Labilithrix sp.]|nr:response regulator [Labilithrix sp.]MCW5816028.1 response regulator [Labilithrix sp.]
MPVKFRPRAASADRIATLSHAYRTESPRVAKLLAGPSRALSQDSDVLREALEALSVHHQELAVAEEELREQLDELTRMGLALESERERYRDLFAFAPDAYVVTDRQGIILEVNDAASALLHVERRFLRAKPLAMFAASVHREALHSTVETMTETTTLDLTMKPRGGDDVRVLARVSVTARGKNLLWGLRRAPEKENGDATSRELRDALELLERERRLRTDLERANRAKDRFIAVLAHDLRSPLNAIMGWTQLLQRELLDQQSRSRALATIHRNALAQANLIEELLDISRLAADKLQLTLAPLDLGLLVQRIVEGFAPKATEQGLALTCAATQDITVVADARRIEQVVSNIVTNAMKYTPAGGSIAVAVARDERRAKVTVEDTGKGIASELLPLVFDMYAQDRSDATTRGGLGLGLHIVKNLVELHDGAVSASSDGEGRGTSIAFWLPLHDEPPPAPSEHELPLPRSLARLHVLVVEDETDERDLVADVLRRAGANVMSAGSVRTALDVFETYRPDVIVSDIAMPEADGIELITALRKRDPTIAAVAISGFTGDGHTERALAAGYDVHIGKPIDAAELVDSVDEAAKLRHR